MHITCLNNNYPTGLIFIPGFLSLSDEFFKIIDNLNLPYSIYQVDLFAEYPLREQLDYETFLDNLISQIAKVPVKQKVLIGYSLGARLAVGCYLKAPDDYLSLILESFNPGIHDQEKRNARLDQDRQLSAGLRDKGFQAFLENWYKNPIFSLSARELETIVASKLLFNQSIAAKALIELSVGAMPSYWKELGKITCPTTLITGAKDLKFTEIAEEVLALIPQGSLIKISNAGHNCHNQNAGDYQQVLRKILEQTD